MSENEIQMSLPGFEEVPESSPPQDSPPLQKPLGGVLRLDGWVQPLGPHGRLRLVLLQVCHHLQQDAEGAVSRVAIRELYRACREYLSLQAVMGGTSSTLTRRTTSKRKVAGGPRRRQRDSKGNRI